MLEGRQKNRGAAIEVAGDALPEQSGQLLGAQRMVPVPGMSGRSSAVAHPERDVVDGGHRVESAQTRERHMNQALPVFAG